MRSNGGVSSSTRPLSRRTSRRSTEAIAVRARVWGRRWPLSTAQACAMASMRHSAFAVEPSGVPSSKYARRYHAPSHAASAAAFKRHHAIAVAACALVLAAGVGQFGKARQQRELEPGQPDAFALAAFADPVHPVVPVARADQRQAVSAAVEADVDRPRAVLEQRAALDRRAETGW